MLNTVLHVRISFIDYYAIRNWIANYLPSEIYMIRRTAKVWNSWLIFVKICDEQLTNDTWETFKYHGKTDILRSFIELSILSIIQCLPFLLWKFQPLLLQLTQLWISFEKFKANICNIFIFSQWIHDWHESFNPALVGILIQFSTWKGSF